MQEYGGSPLHSSSFHLHVTEDKDKKFKIQQRGMSWLHSYSMRINAAKIIMVLSSSHDLHFIKNIVFFALYQLNRLIDIWYYVAI